MTVVRVADMGIFFLIIELKGRRLYFVGFHEHCSVLKRYYIVVVVFFTANSLHAWLTMAASPWVAHEFCYSVTISGNDREAIFSDCVSVFFASIPITTFTYELLDDLLIKCILLSGMVCEIVRGYSKEAWSLFASRRVGRSSVDWA